MFNATEILLMPCQAASRGLSPHLRQPQTSYADILGWAGGMALENIKH
jgi:hypothetical protein